MPKEYLANNKDGGKILQFENSPKIYGKLAHERAERNDLLGALSLAFSSLKKEFSLTALEDIANIYADMGLYEYSNKFWFKYLCSCDKKEYGSVYQDLAINFFYLGENSVSLYYFQKALDLNGRIDKEELDPEILDFFVSKFNKKNAFRLIYPENRADYSQVLKDARLALKIGDFERAEKLYGEIPECAKEYKEALSEHIVSDFITDKDQDALDKTKIYREKFGDDVFVLSNLSSIYHFRKDDDKANYYYKKVLELESKEPADDLKKATTAIEQEDTKRAIEFFEKVIKKDFFEPKLIYIYALSLINGGEYERAREEFYRLLKLDYQNPIYRYYVNLIDKLIEGQKSALRLLPVPYEEELPEIEVKKRTKRLQDLVALPPKNVSAILRKGETKDLLRWGLKNRDGSVVALTTLLLATVPDKVFERYADLVLTDPSFDKRVKKMMAKIWITKGYFGKIDLVTDHMYIKFRARKMPSFMAEGGEIFFDTYVNALLTIALCGEEETDKVAFGADKVYKRFKDSDKKNSLKQDELSALTVYLSGLRWSRDVKLLSKVFNVKKQKLDKLILEFEGEKSDKNN